MSMKNLEFTNKIVGEVITRKYLTEQAIDYIISGALEGGIGYWAVLDNTTEEFKKKPKDVYTSEFATLLIVEGGKITLYDAEDESDKWELTLDKLIKGIQLNSDKRPHDSDLENADATTYDCIIQYALFGEIVYG